MIMLLIGIMLLLATPALDHVLARLAYHPNDLLRSYCEFGEFFIPIFTTLGGVICVILGAAQLCGEPLT